MDAALALGLDWVEAQLDKIKQMCIQNYLAEQTD